MKPARIIRHCASASLAVALLALNVACVGTLVPPRQQALEARIWPPPPEVPRISFENELSRPEDVGIEEGVFRRFFRYLAGEPETPLVNPQGVAGDAQGRLYVVDGYSKQIHIYDRAAGSHRLLAGPGSGFVSPIGVAIDEMRGRVYVSDSAQALVRIFSRENGAVLGEIRAGGMGRPTGLAVNGVTDELLVVDTVNSVILRFALADHAFKGVIGREGTDTGQFHAPTHVAVSRAGDIYVTDSLNFRVQVLNPQGTFVRSFGAPGDSPGYFSRPKGVALDSDGNVYVVDALFDNVQIFDPDGSLLMSFGESGRRAGEFWLPSGIFIDRQDLIYVSDSYNQRVQVFRYLKNAEVH